MLPQIAGKVGSLWLVDGDEAAFYAARRATPEIAAAAWVHFPLPAWQRRYINATLEPSLGWIGGWRTSRAEGLRWLRRLCQGLCAYVM